MKKTFVSIFIALLLLTVATGAVFASTSATEKHIKIQGSFQAVENDEVLIPTIYLHGNGSGDATDLGQFTLHFEGIVHQANGVGTGMEGANITAANGDVLFVTATGLGAPSTTPGVNRIVEKYTINGGTGRYADASGNLNVVRMLTMATGASTGTIEGKIKLH